MHPYNSRCCNPRHNGDFAAQAAADSAWAVNNERNRQHLKKNAKTKKKKKPPPPTRKKKGKKKKKKRTL
jgi:hypothetical protein